MVGIYGRPFIRKVKQSTDIDLSAELKKYATNNEADELLNLAGVDPDEVAIFQDKQGKLKTSNIMRNDIIRKVFGATSGNFSEFTDGGRINDSTISIENINHKIEKSVADRLKTTGDTMTGELSLSGNKITVLRNPTSAEDAASKQYVDAGDSIVDNKLTTLRTEYDAHVTQFVRLRRNYHKKNDEAVEKFYGSPLTVDMKLADINKSLSDINTRLGVVNDKRSFSDLIAGLQTNIAGITNLLDDVINGIPQIVTKLI